MNVKNASITQLALDRPIKGNCESTASKLPLTIDSSCSNVLVSLHSYDQFLRDPYGLLFNHMRALTPGEVKYNNDILTFKQSVFSEDMYLSKDVYNLILKNVVTIVYYGKIVYENPANDSTRYLLYAVLVPVDTEEPHIPNKTIELIYMKNFDGH